MSFKKPFDDLFVAEARINELYIWWEKPAKTSNAMLEEVGELQERLYSHDFYALDAKIDEVARALGVAAFGMDSDVKWTQWWATYKSTTGKTIIRKPDILLPIYQTT